MFYSFRAEFIPPILRESSSARRLLRAGIVRLETVANVIQYDNSSLYYTAQPSL
jgi:hypothetical protein